mmetsp:Transcript_48114/g.58019  ORF Transcript_48114/g.58019 Transcript_48114/m.58019 type:complete len:390 (+) Transcript_48114:64-1233(+)
MPSDATPHFDITEFPNHHQQQKHQRGHQATTKSSTALCEGGELLQVSNIPDLTTNISSPFSSSSSLTSALNATDALQLKENNAAATVEIDTIDDLIAGGVAGMASVVVGHPFDTIKVRMQIAAASTSGGFGGAKSLWNGMSAPLLAAGAINALVFGSFGWSSRVWDEHYNLSTSIFANDGPRSNHQITKNFMCGSFAGFVQTLVLSPTEHIKCRMQMLSNNYNTPRDAVKHIYKEFGITRGLYRGWCCLALRDIPAYGAYFCSYDITKQLLLSEIKKRNNKLKPKKESGKQDMMVASAIAGGFTGCWTWAIVYPLDVIKSRIQTSPLTALSKESRMSVWQMGKDIVKTRGAQHLFRGLNVTLIRSVPVNAVLFPVYEFMLLRLNGQQQH